MDYYDKFRVKPGDTVDLSQIDPSFTGGMTKKEAKKRLKENRERINELQEALYAEGKHSLIVVLQAMDAAGKDGTIEKALGSMNPNGHHVFPFKAPSKEELAHDFLWRVHEAAPAKGQVSTFNRSHYEDVLIVKVHGWAPEDKIKGRYDRINQFEQNLIDENDTGILKFYLHIDEDEQLRRFWDRVADPIKHWKVNKADYEEREYWDDYQEAYQEVFSRCSSDQAPWFIIPGNNKWFARLAVSEIVIQHLESLDIHAPDPEADIEEIKEKYFGIKNPGDAPRFDL